MIVNCFKSLKFERNLEIGLIPVSIMSRFSTLILGAFWKKYLKVFEM